MNICFQVSKPDVETATTEKSFVDGAKQAGILGIKGHRSVGGMRASNYNSIPLEGAERLATYLDSFARS
jgi:phosphoserine aminotransferase